MWSFEVACAKLSDKYIKKTTRFAYMTDLIIFLQSMFKHDIENMSLDNGIPIGTIEKYLITNGICAFTKHNDKIVVGVASTVGITPYSVGDTVIITLEDATVLERKIGIDATVMYNNTLRLPDFNVVKYADMFTEVDTSLKCLLHNTRLHPIPIAKDRQTKTQIESALKDIDCGKPTSILSENILEDLISNTKSETIPVANITDVNASDKIQYVSNYYNDLRKRFFTMYGHAMINTSKLAQQSQSEVKDMDYISMVLPHNMLHSRLQGYDCLNKLFNTNYTCDFSDTWKQEWKEICTETEGDNSAEIDESEGDFDGENTNVD